MTRPDEKQARSSRGGPDERLPDSAHPASADSFPLSERLLELLRSAGIWTVGGLAARSAGELALLPGFGQKSLRQVRAFLARRNLALAPEGPGAGSAHGADSPRAWVKNLEPLVEQRLLDARLWRPGPPGGEGTLRSGVTLADLLRAPGLSPEHRDAALSYLAARAALPPPRDLQELLGLLAACTQAGKALASTGPRLDVAFRMGRLGDRFDFGYRDLHSPPERLRRALTRGNLYGPHTEREAAAQAIEQAANLVRAQQHLGLLHERAALDWPPFARVGALMAPPARTLGGLFQALTRNDPRLPPPGGSAETSGRPTFEDLMRFLVSLGRPDLDSELAHLFTTVAPIGPDARRAVLGAFGADARPGGKAAPLAREGAHALRRAYLADPLPRLRTAALISRQHTSAPLGLRATHSRLESRRLSRSPEATRHALAVLRAVEHAGGAHAAG